jgi:hypothetical protein
MSSVALGLERDGELYEGAQQHEDRNCLAV